MEGPAKDGETVTLEQIDTDDENDEVKQILKPPSIKLEMVLHRLNMRPGSFGR